MCPVMGLVRGARGWGLAGVISLSMAGMEGKINIHWCVATVSIATSCYSCTAVLVMYCICEVAWVLTA